MKEQLLEGEHRLCLREQSKGLDRISMEKLLQIEKHTTVELTVLLQ